MSDEIDDLLEDWYDWQQSYRPKLGYGRADPACREYRSGWRESADLADIADAAARKRVCEAVDACVSRLDLQARIAIQTEMRNRFSEVQTKLRNSFAGAQVWRSIRLTGTIEDEYARAKRMLLPHLLERELVDRTCKLDCPVL
ncbi:hypothetical protein PIN31115_02071 [Pandoraea iniqua]|uniref:Uncharacterized protein n=1 Tax=Pandoraea iniqua TaxID=2508288 RepID=A0A5E4ULG0_9BURK|nr:hypothetical protein [Pandoraea iniqua]VVE00353.1 hypothetical protein PIN31115_02071 [Pandoraea iniqua]